jgi:glycosyltransferase involved in cell wall biosynthesis
LEELFGDDVTVVPKRNVDALAGALGAALASPRRTRPATAALVRAHFSPSSVAAAYRRVYDTCLSRDGRR